MQQNSEIKLGWPFPKRRAFIDQLKSSKDNDRNYPLKFQNKLTSFVVYSCQIDFPKYRLNNGRTQAAQEEYLAKHPELEANFFTVDFETNKVQSVQHSLLKKMVVNTPLWAYFKNTSNSQDQPLILSNEGFVVNGNRRLCTTRELYYGDPKKYAKYSHLDVIILPPCDEKDIDDLEGDLQVQPELKQEYTWIATACMLRARQKQWGYKDSDLAIKYGKKEKEIKELLSLLSQADEYLAYLGKEKQYDLVDNSLYAFKANIKR